MDRAPKVFISYSWKSEEYKETVLRLAERLRGDGVDVILDRWHLKPGHNMLYFMENSIRVADKVLILCESSYVEKANSRKGGAGKETRIISPTVYEENLQEKFIPVFMESHKIVPDYLKDTYGISYQNQSDEEYKELLDAVRIEPDSLLHSSFEIAAEITATQSVPVVPSAEKPPAPEVELPPPLPDEDDEGTELPPPIPPVEDDEPLSSAPVKDFDFEPTPEGVIITKYKGKGGKVKIPDKINGQPVIKIAKEAFDYCETLQSVTIPDTVTAIGTRAFNHCTGLISVLLPASLTRIGNSAFCECSGLKYIEIPDRVESIGQFAFDKCSSLEALTLPAGVRHIYSHAFSGTSLKTVYYDGSKRRWAKIVIEESNEALLRAERRYDVIEKASPVEDFAYISSPDGVTITKYEGKGGEVVIPDEVGGMAVTAIGWNAFEYCKALTSVTIPDSVTDIGDWAFRDCTGLTSVSIPDSVTSIGDLAFCGCTGLTSFSIPDSVTSINDHAFYGCIGLTSVTIPGSVTSIRAWAFRGCENLKDVFYAGSRSQWKAIKIDHNNDPLKNATIHFAREDKPWWRL